LLWSLLGNIAERQNNGNICLDNASISNYWLRLFFVESVAGAPSAILAVSRRKYAACLATVASSVFYHPCQRNATALQEKPKKTLHP
jgi:hypothetical protein